jgi:N-acetylglucosaminyldiphosphoundecaprenol N-acetyl-beta-D-mannosaminyltransferase
MRAFLPNATANGSKYRLAYRNLAMKSPLVLHIIGGGDTGGAMTYLLGLLSGLRTADCDARLLCLGEGGLAEAATDRGLPCEVFPMANPWDPTVIPKLRRRLAGEDWDVIHTHGMRAGFPVRMLMRSIRPRPLLFTTVHSHLALDYSSAVRARVNTVLDRVSAGIVDWFCCVSGELAALMATRGIPESRIRVVYPGVDLSEVERTAADMARTGPDVDKASRMVGTVARLVPVKDLGLLVDVARILHGTIPDLRVVIVGDGPERLSIERKVVAAGLSDVVELRGEVRPAWPTVGRFRVYVLTSVTEGLPLSVLEAMSLGSPVVATAVGGLPEIVEEGVTGFLVPRHGGKEVIAATLAERIARLLQDDALCQEMGSRAKKRAAEKFSTSAAAQAMLSIYHEALAQRGSAQRAAASGAPRSEMGKRRLPPVATARASVQVLGFRLDLLKLEEAADAVMAAVAEDDSSRDFKETGKKPLVAVSVNPELVVRARADGAVAEALRESDLCYPDGVGVVWAASRQGARVERVPGIDLAERVLELSAERGIPVYFLGGAEGIAAEAARRQEERLPGLMIAGRRNGYFSAAEEDGVVQAIGNSGARVLLVGMGAPRQELFIHRRGPDLTGVGAALGIGGSFDVWAGRARRAPRWVQSVRAEWLYRLAKDPRRLRRQTALIRFALQVLRESKQAGRPGMNV